MKSLYQSMLAAGGPAQDPRKASRPTTCRDAWASAQAFYFVAMHSAIWQRFDMTKLQKARSEAGKKASKTAKREAAKASWTPEIRLKRAQNLIRFSAAKVK